MTGRTSLTRKSFLELLAGASLASTAGHAAEPRGKLLIVVAHPDDEYFFAAATYRLAREVGWAADQVILTNGESGYRYSTLAEVFYGEPLTTAGQIGSEARTHLAEIRKQEATRAGKLLGLRNQYFLDQKDLGFDREAPSASTANWDRSQLLRFLTELLSRERYDAVFTLLPTAETHGHHRAATLLALEAVRELSGARPLVFGADARGSEERPFQFRGLEAAPMTRTVAASPVLVFDRANPFGFRDALSYRIVVDWVIAEHKSQGLFQTETGKDRFEEFWLFQGISTEAEQCLARLQRLFSASRAEALAWRSEGQAASNR